MVASMSCAGLITTTSKSCGPDTWPLTQVPSLRPPASDLLT